MKTQRRAFVIGFEGGDATGKTSLIKGFEQTLKAQGKQVLTVHLIHGCAVGDIFYRQFCAGELSPLQQALGMLNSVTTTMQKTVRPVKHAYDIILMDRTLASFATYQLNADGHSYMREPFKNALRQPGNLPDLTVYLEVSPEKAMERLHQRGNLDAIESLGEEHQRMLHDSYERSFVEYPALAPDIRINTTNRNEAQVLGQMYNEYLKQVSGYKNFTPAKMPESVLA